MWLRADNGAPQNICLRLGEVPGYVPKSVEGPPVGYELIGLDVDSYGTKSGSDQLRGLEQKFGDLPDTVRSSARWETRPDSYMALYLVPAGYRYVGKAAPSIDVIQKAHRYLVVWPSRNPDAENALYRWRRPDGAYYEQDDGTILSKFTGRDHHQSYPGRMHGGVITAALDETIGRAIMMRYGEMIWGVTVELNVRFLKPVPLDTPLTILGRITVDKTRMFEGTGELYLPDGTVARVEVLATAPGMLVTQ